VKREVLLRASRGASSVNFALHGAKTPRLATISATLSRLSRSRVRERRQINLNVRNQCLLARSFAEAGFVPILDYVLVDRTRLEEYRKHLYGFDLQLVTLSPAVPVALKRDQERPEKTVAAQWAHLHEKIQVELHALGLWVDNSDLTVEQTTDYVLCTAKLARV
jgi:hypothetical protein